ncbi:hypothetical protein N9948_01775 [bacterium]|nr:hypothetical protein [bacterium]
MKKMTKNDVERFYKKNKKDVHTAGLVAGAVGVYSLTGMLFIPGCALGAAYVLWKRK